MDNFSFKDLVNSQILPFETKGFRFAKSYYTFEKDNSGITFRLILEALSSGREATVNLGIKVNQIDALRSKLYGIKIPKKRSTIYIRSENVIKNYRDARFRIESEESIINASEKIDRFCKEYFEVYYVKYNSIESLDKFVNGETLEQSLVETKPFYILELDMIFIGLIIKKLLGKDSINEQRYYRDLLIRKKLDRSLGEFDRLIEVFKRI